MAKLTKVEQEVAAVYARRAANTAKARIFYPDGRVEAYGDASLALQIYYGLGRGVRAAFRGIGDETPVYSHSYVDKP